MRTTIESCRLFSTKDGADKEYQLRLIQVEEGFIVEYSNGRRGGSLQHGVKTAQPVDEATARKEYASVKKSKMKGGYTEHESGEAFVGTELAGRKTAFAPHLLTPIDEAQAAHLLADPRYVAQIKHNGERRYVACKNGVPQFANRSGLEVPAKAEFAAAVRFLASKGWTDFELDCEDMGTHLMVFDILSAGPIDWRTQGFVSRFRGAKAINTFLANTEHAGLLRFSEILTEVDLNALRAAGEEGVCIKRADAPYIAGRNADQYKLKFWESATVRVVAPNPTKRSVSMAVLTDAGHWVDVGNVTIPVNAPRIPQSNELIEVRYLYAHEGGSLVQPSFEGFRTDLSESDATLAQLKFLAKEPSMA